MRYWTGRDGVFSAYTTSRRTTLARVVVAAALVVTVDGLSISAVAATPGLVDWVKRYSGEGYNNRADAVAVSPDGSTVFVTGRTFSPVTGADFGTVAYDASTGVVRWTKRYSGPGHHGDRANAVSVSPDSSAVFVTGFSTSTTTRDYATVAYDASSGATLWTKRYNGPGSTDVANALGVSPNGARVFVTGWSFGATGNMDYATVAYAAASGTTLWVRRYDAESYPDIATTLAVSPDGSMVFVTGYSQTPSTRYDYATVAYRAGTGEQRWVQRYNDPIDSDDQARSVGVSPDGSTVFVTGYSYQSTTEHDYTTIAYDASTGAELWVELYDGPGNSTDLANALAVSPDGSSVLVTGQDYSYTTGYDYATVAYDASTGARLWAKRYASTDSTDSSRDEATDIDVSPDSSTVIVTGYSSSATTPPSDYTTFAYDASSGSKLWSKRYDGPAGSADVARALDVSASAAFVTGYSYPASGFSDYATVAYALA